MYDLSNSLSYDEPLQLLEKYQYDFLGMDFVAKYHTGILKRNIFVFRTIKYGEGKNNVLLDLIDCTNVNAFDAAMQDDCNFHMLKSKKILEDKEILITNNISLGVIENTSNYEYYAILKNQKYTRNDEILKAIEEDKELPIVKYLLFTVYKKELANIDKVELAPIFNLQKELIWHNNRYYNYNDLRTLDVNPSPKRKLNPLTPWNEVQSIVNRERKDWQKEKCGKLDQLLRKCRFQRYVPIE